MPKTQMPSKGQQTLVGGEKPRDKLEGDQVEHLQGWTTIPTKANKMVKKIWMIKVNDVNVVHEGKEIKREKPL